MRHGIGRNGFFLCISEENPETVLKNGARNIRTPQNLRNSYLQFFRRTEFGEGHENKNSGTNGPDPSVFNGGGL
jgi:hypothetical protein